LLKYVKGEYRIIGYFWYVWGFAGEYIIYNIKYLIFNIMTLTTRRRFIKITGSTAVLISAFGFSGLLKSCGYGDKGSVIFIGATDKSYPILEVKGGYFDIGHAIGSTFRDQITAMFDERKGYFDRMRNFIDENQDFYEGMLAASEKYFPHLVKEMEGISAGAGIPFRDIFILNIKAEIGAAIMDLKNDTPGCSTIHYSGNGKKFYIHNEDGDESNNGRMFMVKATPPSGVSFYVMTYPGILMGNGPAMNDHGITQSTNYIASLEYRLGVPRYVLGRAILESKNMDEAISIASHPERAFAYHHNLGSFTELKMISLEVSPSETSIYEPNGIYCHTNHLVLEETKNCPQDTAYVNSSSMSRYEVLEKEIDETGDQDHFTRDRALQMLSSHEQKPWSPCRHPEGDVNGRTLGTVLFDINKREMLVYKGNPCVAHPESRFTSYVFDM